MKKIKKEIILLEFEIKKKKTLKEAKFILSEMKKIGIEKLPYSYSALKPFIDPETMKIHYTKHYLGYVEKLNVALKKRKGGDKELEDIIKNIDKFSDEIRNNAGGAFNHALFWNMLTPNPKKLEGKLLDKIKKDFGSFAKFKKEFEEKSKSNFGSGWCWLVVNKNNNLKILSTPNQDNPLMNVVENAGFPILGLDLWEHAFYLKYQNNKEDYIKNFWKVVNWDFVNNLFEMKTESELLESEISRQIISEGLDYVQSCSRKEENFFNNLLKIHDISIIYGVGIYEALKKVPWLEYRKKDQEQGILQGFYKNGERHKLSYLPGNYRAFCLITKSINKLLRLNDKQPIIFSNKTVEEQKVSVQKLVNFVIKYSHKIFDEESPFFNKIMENLGQSIQKGEKTENSAFKRLKQKFGEENIKVSSGFGVSSDSEGLDGIVTIDGKSYTIQIKPFIERKFEQDKIYIRSTGKLVIYTQDWMVFNNDNETIVVDNKSLDFSKYSYIYPKENVLFIL